MTTIGTESETSGVATAPIRGRLGPVAHRGRWIAGGLALQLVGLGAPTAYVVTKARHESIAGLVSVATVRLAWRESLHAHAGIAVLAAGAVLFALGSVVLARPFVKRRLTLVVAVPLAALCGALILGLAALLVVLLYLWAENGGGGDIPTGSGGRAGPGTKSPPRSGADEAPDVPV
ncbi:hypothetical protein [Actinacidiphila acidipaludis]|uniref:Uncharacterized protein n=1 Tax=Actinacidiphila acidipaludis TaxID=2873382 RepID=A0ABS7QE68_9ACTN|nr:hypothetical protein [Streptomyces acidipaludis]MBY8881116.1 hypothetical protein [Streptomyces acidipaludis]